jgi:hypothetical protein
VTTPENDPFETFDAAYLLGALSPEDRQAYDLHLRQCPECARSLEELSALPGLLSQVTPEMVQHESPSSDLLSLTLTRVARVRRRRSAAMVAAVGVAAAACIALAVTVSWPRPASEPPQVAMVVLGNYPVQADIGLEDQGWGTRVSMSCSYGETGGRSRDYVLVAVRHDGEVAELASWTAMPQDTARIVVGTALKRTDIGALEVRTRSGLSVLRLTS